MLPGEIRELELLPPEKTHFASPWEAVWNCHEAGKEVTLTLGMPPSLCPCRRHLPTTQGASAARPSHPHPSCQRSKILPVTPGKAPAQEAVLLETFAVPEVSLAPGLDALQQS